MSIDRTGYSKMLEVIGITAEQLQQITDSAPVVELPELFADAVEVRASEIAGVGVFATKPLAEDTLLGPMVSLEYAVMHKTTLGRYTNHSAEANAYVVMSGAKDGGRPWVVAARDIGEGEEIVTDYVQVVKAQGVVVRGGSS